MSCAKARLEVVVDHRVAAVLHNDERAAEAFEPRERLDECARLCGRGLNAQMRSPRSDLMTPLSFGWCDPALVCRARLSVSARRSFQVL
jgi:hypothetical protein